MLNMLFNVFNNNLIQKPSKRREKIAKSHLNAVKRQQKKREKPQEAAKKLSLIGSPLCPTYFCFSISSD